MILSDFNGIAVAGTVAAAFRDKTPMEKSIIKHIVISSFRNIHTALAKKYGDHIMLVDSRSWRKDVFEHYKASRQKEKEDSAVDWDLIFEVMNELRDEFDKYFPFYVIREYGCEADDLIAAFAFYANKNQEHSVIVSKDKDFHQLISPYVKQYHPGKKEFFDIEDPHFYKLEHYIRAGDDGIPNVLSDDDTFVTEGKRQKVISKKRFPVLFELAKNDFRNITQEQAKICGTTPEVLKRNFDRNKQMIQLIDPYEPAFRGVEKYHEQRPKDVTANDTANYFAKNKMVVLMGKVPDFFVGRTTTTKEKQDHINTNTNKQTGNTGNSLSDFLS